MRKSVKNIAMVLCSILMTVALVFGITTLNVKANDDTPTTVSLLDGASLKIDAKDPSLIFTADVQDYDADATYGVLVVENALLEGNAITEDYIAKLDELGLAYEKIECKPFVKDEAHRIKAYFSVEPESFDVDYAGIAFVDYAGVYTYTELTENNVRSVKYVAEKALETESLSAIDEATLKSWTEMFDGGEYKANNTVASINVDKMNVPGDNGAEIVSFITSTYFCGGSTVEFDIFVPTALADHFEAQGRSFRNCWISVCWTTDRSETDMYAHVDPALGVNVNSQIIPGKWSHVSVVIPGESNVYVYVSSAKSEWGGNTMLIDNFKVTEDGIEYLEDFEGDLEYVEFHGNPNAEADGVSAPVDVSDIVELVNVPCIEGEAVVEGECAIKNIFDVGKDEVIPFVSKDAFEAGSTVEFMYYIDAPAYSNGWLIWAWTDRLENLPYYAQTKGSGADLPVIVGKWNKASVKLPETGGPYYIYFASSVGGWNADGEQTAHVLFDNFVVNGELYEDFNKGINASNFMVKNAICVDTGDGYVAPAGPEYGEYAMKLSAATQSGYIQTATTQTFPAGSTVTFKYYIPEGTTTQWWRTGYKSTEPDREPNKDYYDAPYVYNDKTVGVWSTQTVTLPTDAESYYIFFVFEDGGWSATYGEPYVLIDDFAIDGEVVEDFNNGLGIFEARTTGATLGDGYVASEPPVIEPGEYAIKVTFDVGMDENVPFISKQAFEAGSTVEFRYYIDAPEKTNGWLIWAWTDSLDYTPYYAQTKDPRIGADIPTTVGQWNKASVTLPETGGPYYIYFASSVGGWNATGEQTAHVLFDNFVVNGELYEDFNNGIENCAFSVMNEVSVSYGDGYGEPEIPTPPVFEPGEHAAKLDFSSSFGYDTKTFMTKEAVAKGGDRVILKFYIPEESTVGTWWFIGWSTTKDGADFWVPNQVKPVNGGLGLGTTKGQWVTATIDIPTDEEGYTYYLYVCGYENWSGPVYIDDVVVSRNGETVAEESFNENPADWMFNIGNVDYVSYGDGYIAPEAPDSYGAKIVGDLISTTASTPSFITKERYVSDGSLVVTFDYMVVGNDKPAWWILAWTNDNTKASLYAHVEGNDYAGGIDLPKENTDGWQTATVTIPAGEWYLYIALEVGQWGNQDGEQGRGYVVIDNFRIGDIVTETFENTNNANDPSDFGIFLDNRNAKHSNAIELVEGKIGGDEPVIPEPPVFEPGEYAMKLFAIDHTGIIPAASNVAFAGGSEVSFMYYIPEGTTTKWWRLSYTASVPNTAAYTDYYEAAHFTVTEVVGAWTKFTAVLPTDAESYYIFFVTEEGSWKGPNDEVAYILIDNVTVNGEVVEDFNNGFVSFELRTEGAELGDGYVAPELPTLPENGAAKITVDLISGTTSTPSFITKGKYVSDGSLVVTFDYYMSGNTINKWWAFFWTNDNTVASIYAHVENNKENNSGIDLPVGTQDAWATASVTIPAGEWYFYIGGAVGEWGRQDGEEGRGYVIIDNFKIGNLVTETFDNTNNLNDESDFGIFVDNRSSKPNAITLVEGKPAVEESTPDPELPEGEGYLVVDFKAFEEGRINLHTKQAYTNITEFYVDIYVPSAEAFDWYGFTPASAVSGKDAYFAACTSDIGLKTSMGYYGWYGEWVTVKYIVEDGVWNAYLIRSDGTEKHKDHWRADFSGADYVSDGASYIILSANPGRSYEWGMWIDNVRIVADGVTYEDTFSNGESTLFDYSSAVTVVYEA